jgi:metallo-beta-lactamase family protein
MYPPTNQKKKKSRLCLLKSTYGDRIHPDTDPKLGSETYINNTVQEGR